MDQQIRCGIAAASVARSVGVSPVSRAGISSSGALARSVALRLAAPRRLAAALAAAAPSEDIPTLLPTRSCTTAPRSGHEFRALSCPRALARRAKLGVPAQTRRASVCTHGTTDRTTSALAPCHGRRWGARANRSKAARVS